MAIVLITIVLPIAAGALMVALPRSTPPGTRSDRMLSRAAGTAVAVATFGMLIATRDAQWSIRWLSRPFTAAFHFGATPVSFWICLLLALCTACAIATTRLPRTRDFVALLLMLEGAMLGLFLARDLLVFALFWDLMLLPVFFALLRWGEVRSAAHMLALESRMQIEILTKSFIVLAPKRENMCLYKRRGIP